MERKKKKNYLVIILILSFIFFASLYLSGETGYFEYGQYKKTVLTNERIEKFESDLDEGKELSDSYIANTYKDYSNTFSKVGLKTSTYIEKLFTEGIKTTFKYISKLVLE